MHTFNVYNFEMLIDDVISGRVTFLHTTEQLGISAKPRMLSNNSLYHWTEDRNLNINILLCNATSV